MNGGGKITGSLAGFAVSVMDANTRSSSWPLASLLKSTTIRCSWEELDRTGLERKILGEQITAIKVADLQSMDDYFSAYAQNRTSSERGRTPRRPRQRPLTIVSVLVSGFGAFPATLSPLNL